MGLYSLFRPWPLVGLTVLQRLIRIRFCAVCCAKTRPLELELSRLRRLISQNNNAQLCSALTSSIIIIVVDCHHHLPILSTASPTVRSYYHFYFCQRNPQPPATFPHIPTSLFYPPSRFVCIQRTNAFYIAFTRPPPPIVQPL